MMTGVPVSSSLRKDTLVLATNANQVSILNLKNTLLMSGKREYAKFDGPLYHKVEHVGLNSDSTQLAISGAEGRIAVRELNMVLPFDS